MKFPIICSLMVLLLSCGLQNNTNSDYLIPFTESGDKTINLACKYENGVLTVKGVKFIVPVKAYPYLSAYKNNSDLAMNVYGLNVSKSEGVVVFCATPGTCAKKLKRL